MAETKITETAAPEGYNIDLQPSKNVQVKSGSPVTVKFENDKNATLRIVKTDKVTGRPMENVEFTIVRDDGKTYGKHYTNKLGEINLEYDFPARVKSLCETTPEFTKLMGVYEGTSRLWEYNQRKLGNELEL